MPPPFDLGLHNPLGVALAAIPMALNVGVLVHLLRNLPRDRLTAAFAVFVACQRTSGECAQRSSPRTAGSSSS